MNLLFYLLLTFLSITGGAIKRRNKVTNVYVKHHVVPDVIHDPPKLLIKVTYNNNQTVKPGMVLTPTLVRYAPKVDWHTPVKNAYYTLIVTGPDAPSRAHPKFREFRHWLVVNIPNNDITMGETIVDYMGAGPRNGTGLHRYVFLLYKQPKAKLNIGNTPYISSESRQGRLKFKTAKFVKQHRLRGPVAGNFFFAAYDDFVPIMQAQQRN